MSYSLKYEGFHIFQKILFLWFFSQIRNGIATVINLQHPGEHASCGFGLEDSGFSYVPQQFMDEDGMGLPS